MEYSLESNERTLVMFDAVSAGLTSCLALVHADIRHMTEHRNRLAQLEQEQIRAKCRPAEELFAISKNKLSSSGSSSSEMYAPEMRINDKHESNKGTKKQRHPLLNKGGRNNNSDNLEESNSFDPQDNHYLAGLKFLDKRLAETFSQAFNANELQKSSLAAKEQAYHSRPSIFQVLLGKTLSRKSSISSSSSTSQHKVTNNKKSANPEKKSPADKSSAGDADNKLIIDDINRQIRLAMQYIKQLESHLFKLEDLRPKYEMHLKMGLVVRNNNNHYSSTTSLKSSKNKSESKLNSTTSYGNINNPNNNRTTIRDFIDNISRIEQEFESYTGSFLLTIEDIQGFARVCQGDVFEITIKYGESQKFKSRISVLKDNKQKCDNRQTLFKAKVADILAIKAYECKGLGKRVLLGHKLCETKDLFTAQSQLMTISLNQTGSIKLNMVVTWNPLHMAPTGTISTPGLDISHISLPATPISTSTLSSLSSLPSINGTTTTINIKSHSRHKLNDSFTSSDNSYHNNNNSPNRHSYNRQQKQKQASLYQTIDPTYGYYIPEPDYLPNEGKYCDS